MSKETRARVQELLNNSKYKDGDLVRYRSARNGDIKIHEIQRRYVSNYEVCYYIANNPYHPSKIIEKITPQSRRTLKPKL